MHTPGLGMSVLLMMVSLAGCGGHGAPASLPVPTADPGHQVTAPDLGLPVYPGARSVGSAAVTDHGVEQRIADYETPDPLDKVGAFYRERIKSLAAGRELSDTNTGNFVLLILQDPNDTQMTTSVTITRADNVTALRLSVPRRVSP